MHGKKKVIIFSTQEIAFLSLITAACVVGRFLFQWIPNIQPMTAIFILLTIYLGVTRGLIVNVLSLLITNMYLGMGIWTFSQVASFTLILLIAAGLNHFFFFKQSVWLQALYSFIAGLIYGFVFAVIDTKMYGMSNFWVYYFSGLSFDILHAIGNFGFYLVLAPILKPLFEKLQQKKAV